MSAGQLATIEKLVVQGNMKAAHLLLRPLLKKRIERKLVVTLANLARRAHLPEYAVAILHHIVRPSLHSPIHATDAEIGEYAASLNAIGAAHEADKLLSEVDSDKFPNALLFRGYVHIWQWDWEGAVPYLEQYCKLPNVDPHMRFWGSVNLAQSLMHGCADLVWARTLLTEVVANTGLEQYRHLHKNAHLGMAQVQILAQEWEQAQSTIKYLQQKELKDDDQTFDLVLEQWKSIAQLSRGNLNLAPLRKVRAQFEVLKRWENVRSCDYYEAICTHDTKLLTQLYFGTTYPAMRKRILTILGGEQKIPLNYQWSFFRQASSHAAIIDLQNGVNNLGPSFLKEGQIPQRLLQTLGQDFYKPMRISELHERLYPKQFYHPTAAPDRLYQALKRLRSWLGQNHIPLAIKEDSGFYSLDSTQGCLIQLAKDVSTPALKFKLAQQLAKLQNHFFTSSISAAKVPSVLGVSQRSSIRILNELCRHGRIERIHKGPKTYYRLRPA
ncbi:MAG: hypothetical protein A2X86_22275 [Bdellovibrionales bacterium GWA2_49_15]|nr:MAG: hypothetical protein A2X86_22275 [Bdellovibrionales bacterium GWA2_49_15]HAZ14794.1 hypothetical protein [Bdellovibrionales bacterium]